MPPQPFAGDISTGYDELAVDNVARRIYVSTGKQNFATGQETDAIDSFQTDSPRAFVDSIPIDGGISLLGSFPLRSISGAGNGIAVAPL